MGLAVQIVLLVHLIGFAALFGGIVVQFRVREPEVNASMLHGSYTMLITGIGLAVFGLLGIGDLRAGDPINIAKLVITTVVAAIVTFLVIINRRFTSIPKGLWGLLGVLTLGNAAVAVLWQ
ncbi:MAG: hypothetical protein J2P23_05310 [Microlunatus sp.]|nr:hypothetical protein [Microlunatus sp.]